MLSLYIPISNEILAIPHEDKRWKEEISPGDFVLFRDEEGNEEYAKALLRHEGEVEFMSDTLRILRKANDHDIQKIGYIEKKGLHATVICQKYADSLNLNMNVVRSDYSFDESMINFVFVSEDRVDFRELLKKLSGKFRKSIHLQQVGPRDKAKLVGGLGVCGRELCCHKFLSALPSVTMESARNQGIMHRGTDSLTGACGKLKCCLRFEDVVYKELRKGFPDYGQSIKFQESSQIKEGVVIGFDILEGKIKIKRRGQERGITMIKIEDIQNTEK